MRTILATALLLLSAWPAAAQEGKTLTVDAAEQGAYVRLGDEARLVEVDDPGTSSEWDIAFVGTSVLVNGGESGSGGVTAHCICQNAGAPDEEIQAMSPESELGDFLSVTRAQAPADEARWHPAAIAAAPWYRYNLTGQHLIWPTYDVYLVRRDDEVYKLQVTGYYGADGTPRQVTFRYGRL